MDKNGAQTVLSLLMKYRPEDKAAKKERLQKEAEAKVRLRFGWLLAASVVLWPSMPPIEPAHTLTHIERGKWHENRPLL